MKKLLLITLLITISQLGARPISKPLAIFESTKLPHRTLKDGLGLFNILPFVDRSNLSKDDKKKYEQMVKEKKRRDIQNQKYWNQKTMRVLNSANLPKPKKAHIKLPNLF